MKSEVLDYVLTKPNYKPLNTKIMPNTDKWLAIEDYNDMIAKQLQEKIAEDLYLYESKEFDKWLDELAEKNGVTEY